MWIFFFAIAILIFYNLANKHLKSRPAKTVNPSNTPTNKQSNTPKAPDKKSYKAPLATAPSQDKCIPIHTLSFIAGIPHRLGKNVRISTILSEGQPLQYLREPGNQHDKNAIKLLADEKHIGYIPKDDNPKIAQHLDSGKEILVSVISIDSSDLWRGIRIKVILI